MAHLENTPAPTALLSVSNEFNPATLQAVSLTAREREVLHWLKEGKTNWEISIILKMSERTAKFHVTNILGKLGASTRSHAVALAYSQNLITN